MNDSPLIYLCEKILEELADCKYGNLDIRTMKPLAENDTDASHILVCKPEELKKYKRGTCWDQSLYIYNSLKSVVSSADINVIACWISTSEMDCTSHTTVAVRDQNNEWYWIESTWDNHNGINGPFASSKEVMKEIEKYQPKSKASLYKNNVNRAYDKLLSKSGKISGRDFIRIVFDKVPILNKDGKVEYWS